MPEGARKLLVQTCGSAVLSILNVKVAFVEKTNGV